MIGIGLEPEPLAFRIRPQAEECVDSWLDRLTAAHETTRAALFRHLGIDPALAGMDLARGKDGLAPSWHGAFDHMVERLAWAVQTVTEPIGQTFLACGPEALLPRRLRRYACARCWHEARRASKPLIVQREWILRACWRCRDHELPLSDMARMGGLGEDRRGRADLAGLVLRAERLRWKIPASSAAVRSNATVLHYLVRSAEWQGLAAPCRPYQRRFAANLYHFSADRIALLLLAHSRRSRGAHRFERLISARLPERPTPGGGTLGPKKRPYRLMPRFQARPRPKWIAPDHLDLVFAYTELRNRRHRGLGFDASFERMEQAALAFHERATSRTPRPTSPGKRRAG